MTLPPYPPSHRLDLIEHRFGHATADPYRWLEADDAQVHAWVQAQNDYTQRWLAAMPGRATLLARLHDLAATQPVGVPVRRGGRCFYRRRDPICDRTLACVLDEPGSAERTLLDPDTLYPAQAYALGFLCPSPDGKRLALGLKRHNADQTTLHLVDVATGVPSSAEKLPVLDVDPAWVPSGEGFYYVHVPPVPADGVAAADRRALGQRLDQIDIRFHRWGSDPADDVVIVSGDGRTVPTVQLSEDGCWLFHLRWRGGAMRAASFCPLDPGDAAAGRVDPAGWRVLFDATEGQHQLVTGNDRFYLRTTRGAPGGQVVVIDPRRPTPEDWQVLIAERGDVILEQLTLAGGHLVLTVLTQAAHQIEVYTLAGERVHVLGLPERGTVSTVSGHGHDDMVYFGFSAFLHPPEVLGASLVDGTIQRFAASPVRVDRDDYAVEQVEYPSRDGTPIPMYLVGRRALERDGGTPFLLSGYGGFGLSQLPSFLPYLLPWLEAGGGFALTNLRGGGERGAAWHSAGKGVHKQNTFDDFAAAAEFLVTSGYTQPERLAVRGGSNGGLVVGALITQWPTLCRAAVCAAPILDMLRYDRFGAGAVTVPEYGSPDDPTCFHTLAAYSPYHRVVSTGRRSYPAVLLLSAGSDDRVDPMHARKMAAALQAAQTGDRPILLRTELHAGHGGTDSRSLLVEQLADMLVFLFHETGLDTAALLAPIAVGEQLPGEPAGTAGTP